jgi:dipeptidyl aminopeptidase/acylaminoacyl peptidase
MVRERLVPAAVALLLARAGGAQQAPLIPLERFFDSPAITLAQISPDGAWLAYLKPYRGKLNLHVRPVSGGEERRLTGDTLRPIIQYRWSADGRRLLYLQDRGGNENFHLFALPVRGGVPDEARDLTPFDSARTFLLDVPRDLPGRVLVALNRRDPSAFDAYWLDLASGTLTLAAANPGRFGTFYADRRHRVRVADAQGPGGETEIHARRDDRSRWRLVASYPAGETVQVLRVHPDGDHLFLLSDHGSTQFARLVSLDLRTGRERVVAEDPLHAADASEVLFGERADSVLWVGFDADTVRLYPRTAALARDLARIRALHDGTPAVSSMTRDERRWVVSFNSPTDPFATYLYDRTTGRGEFLFRPRPWLDPAELAPMAPVSFPARDSLTIHGYLTTPKGVEPHRLPMVLLVHGGPWARDEWGYQPEVQFLANRGYAVLQVNYRGSTGYGKAFYNAAVRQFADRMHSDLLDGVAWAVDQGIADPRRVCIYGGSYGGYATLVGVTFTPDAFACAVDYVGPSSLVTLVQSFPAYWRPFLESTWYRFVGDPAKPADRADMWRRSPLSRVDSVRTPLLIVQGANDPRVTRREADQLALALQARGVAVRYLVAGNEGHGFLNPENRLALYRVMEQFIGRYLGGRVQPDAPTGVDARIDSMTVAVDTLKPAGPPAAPTLP